MYMCMCTCVYVYMYICINILMPFSDLPGASRRTATQRTPTPSTATPQPSTPPMRRPMRRPMRWPWRRQRRSQRRRQRWRRMARQSLRMMTRRQKLGAWTWTWKKWGLKHFEAFWNHGTWDFEKIWAWKFEAMCFWPRLPGTKPMKCNGVWVLIPCVLETVGGHLRPLEQTEAALSLVLRTRAEPQWKLYLNPSHSYVCGLFHGPRSESNPLCHPGWYSCPRRNLYVSLADFFHGSPLHESWVRHIKGTQSLRWSFFFCAKMGFSSSLWSQTVCARVAIYNLFINYNISSISLQSLFFSHFKFLLTYPWPPKLWRLTMGTYSGLSCLSLDPKNFAWRYDVDGRSYGCNFLVSQAQFLGPRKVRE